MPIMGGNLLPARLMEVDDDLPAKKHRN